jgi:hypothetical protein
MTYTRHQTRREAVLYCPLANFIKKSFEKATALSSCPFFSKRWSLTPPTMARHKSVPERRLCGLYALPPGCPLQANAAHWLSRVCALPLTVFASPSCRHPRETFGTLPLLATADACRHPRANAVGNLCAGYGFCPYTLVLDKTYCCCFAAAMEGSLLPVERTSTS